MSVISTKLYFVEIGWVRQKLYIFKCIILKNSEFRFSRLRKHLNRETPIYSPFAISLMHFSDKSVSYRVNDWFNFDVIDRSFSQRSNFLFQKQTKNVICFSVMTKLTAANQKPLTLWSPNLVTFVFILKTCYDQILAKLINQGDAAALF